MEIAKKDLASTQIQSSITINHLKLRHKHMELIKGKKY